MKVLFSGLLIALYSCSSVETVSGKPEVRKERGSKPLTLLEEYQAHMRTLGPAEKLDSCASVNYKSHRNLRRNQRNIYLSNPQMAIPNYNGIYLLLESPITEGSEWFVINCRTGMYETIVPATEDLIFDSESSVLVTKTFKDSDTRENASGAPKILEWTKREWVSHENPVQKD